MVFAHSHTWKHWHIYKHTEKEGILYFCDSRRMRIILTMLSQTLFYVKTVFVFRLPSIYADCDSLSARNKYGPVLVPARHHLYNECLYFSFVPVGIIAMADIRR